MKLAFRTTAVRVFVVLLVVLTFTHLEELAAKSIYVGPDGSDSNSGSLTSPFGTINKGLSALQPGDTLFLRGGTYREALDSNSIAIPSGTSFPNATTVQAYNGEIVTIQPGSGDAAVNVDGDIHHTVWKDLIIDAVHVQFGVRLSDGAHHNRFLNVEVKNARLSGILTSEGTGGTNFNEFINCKSHNNGSSVMDHGIYLATSDNLVEGGEYYNNVGFGIQLYNDSPSVNRNVIRQARSCNNGMYGIIITSGDANIAHSNIVCNNARGGIEVNWGTGSTNTKLYNNTVYRNSGEGIAIGSNNTNVSVTNNIVFMNSDGVVDYGSTGTVRSNNNDVID